VRLFAFDFGAAESGARHRSRDPQRMGPSLALALPVFLIGLRRTSALRCCSCSSGRPCSTPWAWCLRVRDVDLGLFYIIGGQYLVGKLWNLVPISGFGEGLDAWRFSCCRC
jgi:peptide/nickel transport system permease protein